VKEVTKIMIKKYCLDRLKFDFMGYQFLHNNELSFHHLIIPRRLCKDQGLGEGFLDWNGAILKQTTAHDYLHVVERYDRDMFEEITKQMIIENEQGYLDMNSLKRIDDVLKCFEKEYINERTTRGEYIIKEEYTRRIVNDTTRFYY